MARLVIDFLIDGDMHSYVELEVEDENDAMVYADAIADQIMSDYPDQVVEGDGDEEDEDES